MIKKILAAGAFAASAVFLVPLASAQTFSPNGPFTLTSIASITFNNGLTLTCNSLNGIGSVSGGAASVSSITVSGGGCGVVFTGTPYVISSSSPTSITLNGIVISSWIGGCAGSLTGDYDQSTGVITFRGATIPSTTYSNPCRLYGRVQLSPAVIFTIP
ncbi:hypothetical protein [Sphingomonas psychrotolerans]|uniref:Protein activator of alkane oxidation PraB n=1 Tax=Sphingomonas psychrotolerans TaxID=1327635 RepID=A0A2K8MAV0_9SPHN|nr:hypothetical protein [Sphingomonas psychrotolerans]ATY31012.1 hypothetical protein CVN68_02600 [Sphingomonas psychrotolerans]